jgi:hypothetical protein
MADFFGGMVAVEDEPPGEEVDRPGSAVPEEEEGAEDDPEDDWENW